MSSSKYEYKRIPANATYVPPEEYMLAPGRYLIDEPAGITLNSARKGEEVDILVTKEREMREGIGAFDPGVWGKWSDALRERYTPEVVPNPEDTLEYIPLEYFEMVTLDLSFGDITLQLTEDKASRICLHAVDLCPSHTGPIMLTGMGRPGILWVSVAKLKQLGII